MLAVAEGSKEDTASWTAFLRQLKQRGLAGVQLFISDKCLGLVEQLAEFYPEAHWQRCVVHFYRNVWTAVPSGKVQEMAAMLKAIHAQEDAPAARQKAQQVVGKLRKLKLACFVEKLQRIWIQLPMDRVDHCLEQGFGQLPRRCARPQPGSHHALHSADEAFHRPPLTVLRRQACVHLRAPVATDAAISPMHRRRYPTRNARPIPTPFMHPFGIVAGIGIQLRDRHALLRFGQQLRHLGLVVAWTPVGHQTHRDQRPHHHTQTQFDVAFAVTARATAGDEVAAGAPRLQPRRVHSDTDGLQSESAQQLRQQAPQPRRVQPPLREPPQRREIRRAHQSQAAFYANRNLMALDKEGDWVLGKDYSAAPTCATCHLGSYMTPQGVAQGNSHDVGERISWTLRPVISVKLNSVTYEDGYKEDYPEGKPLPKVGDMVNTTEKVVENEKLVAKTVPRKVRSITTWEQRREKMKGACLDCHNHTYVDNFYQQFDELVELYNNKFAKPAQAMMDQLIKDGVLNPQAPFEHEVQWVFWELWHHEGRRARHGASMMGPDYTHWHGMYEVGKHYYTEFLPAVIKAAEEKSPELGAKYRNKVAELLNQPEHTWLKGLTQQEADALRKAYQQRYNQ